MESPLGQPPDELSDRFGHPDAAPDFFFAVRVAQAHWPSSPAIGTASSPRRESVRFSQKASITFPPRTIADTTYTPDGRLRFALSFMGLLGPAGPLPLHLTTIARRRTGEAQDGALVAFLDMFNHRMISLFYRAHAVHRLTMSSERPELDRYRAYITSASGQEPEWGVDDALADAALFFSGRLAACTRNPEGLVAILRRYFACPVKIGEFVPSLVQIPDEARMRLGVDRESATLGHSAFLGARTTDVQHRVRIALGPLTLAQYERLLPELRIPGQAPEGGVAWRRLHRWILMYTGDEFDYEVELVVHEDHRPPSHLGKGRLDEASLREFGLGRSGRIGRTIWIGCARPSSPARDFVQRRAATASERAG